MNLSTSIPSRAVVIGSYGQDGTLLCRELEKSDFPVTPIGRNDCNLLDYPSVSDLFSNRQRHDVYFLAAIHRSSEAAAPQNFLADFQASLDLHVRAPATILECMRQRNCGDRFFFASSSRVFGLPGQAPQNENTPRTPTCVYGMTKSAGMDICRHYRETHGVHALSGILYNHESPLRPLPFLSKKLTTGAIACRQGKANVVKVGRLDTRVDWSDARDVVRAMSLALNAPVAQDYVIASGQTHTVREFAEFAFDEVGLDWKNYVVEDAPLTHSLMGEIVGNPHRLTHATGWKPDYSFEEMVRSLVREELANASNRQ